MALHDDVNNALLELSKKAPNLPNDMQLNASGFYRIPVPIPPALIDLREGLLPIDLQVAPSGKFFSMITPLAVFEGQGDRAFLEALLYRQFYADQVSGASFAISVTNDHDILVAVYHWLFDSISPEMFKKLYQKYMAATFTLIDELNEMAERTDQIHPIHNGRS